MVHHNISPETLMCGCCPRSRHIVPELGYRICEKRTGLVPKVLVPVLKRRRLYKALKEEKGPKREMYEQRSKMLKWLLVTCFGYAGYRNARFGRIECHEAINAFGRDILVRSADLAEKRGFEVLHGIVDSLWLRGEGDITSYCEEATREAGIDLHLEGRYDWIVFLPNLSTGIGALNRYYGRFENGELKLRGIALRRRDAPGLVEDLQRDMLERLSAARDPPLFPGRDAVLPGHPGPLRVEAARRHRAGGPADDPEERIPAAGRVRSVQRSRGRAAPAARRGLRPAAGAGRRVPPHRSREQELVGPGEGGAVPGRERAL